MHLGNIVVEHNGRGHGYPGTIAYTQKVVKRTLNVIKTTYLTKQKKKLKDKGKI